MVVNLVGCVAEQQTYHFAHPNINLQGIDSPNWSEDLVELGFDRQWE